MMKNCFTLLILVALIASCKKDQTAQPICLDEISYTNDVVPILMNSCATTGCHSAEANANGMNFTNYDAVFEHREQIVKAIRHESGATPMPIGANQLSTAQISAISCWIEQGALNN